ncbi:MAG: hypothetical protein K8Q91_01455 [Candidatus Vogelbacteria bacterium]|nr:hypothetical protein [Candidatus Vogelbacteria bacterium]
MASTIPLLNNSGRDQGQIMDNFSDLLSDKDTVWIHSAVILAPPHDKKWLILFSRSAGQPLRAVWFEDRLDSGEYVWLATDKKMLLVPPTPIGKVGVKPGEG